MILPQGDAAPILIATNNNDSTYKTNVSVIDNYFGDHTWFPFEVQLAGYEKPMRGLNVTFDQAYFNANQANNGARSRLLVDRKRLDAQWRRNSQPSRS